MRIYNWFQNLAKEDKSGKLFHFRGQFGPDYDKIWLKYEMCSGYGFRVGFTIKPYRSLSLSLHPIFFSMHLTFPFFSFARWIKQKKVTTLYWYHWSLVWSWMADEWESKSGLPWYKSFYFHVDDFFLGQAESLEHSITHIENVKFKIGDKEFLMNKIEWKRYRRFRRHIPFSLYHHAWTSVKMDIEKPPMRAGKGENSWDIENDGSFGMSMPWRHESPSWNNRPECARLAILDYIKSAQKDAKRYGSGSGERGISAKDTFEVCL